jgi:argininosuccinate synthase
MKKMVLAYSGGLDTSYCARYLSYDKGFEVHAVSVNTGGFSNKDLGDIEKKAIEIGVKSYKSINAVEQFYNTVIKYLVFGNVLKNNTYPLSVSAERIVQALEIVKYAKKIKAKYIAHGSTGAGNDQVRFDMIFQILAPDIKIITPIRDQKLSRQFEIDYLNKMGIKTGWEQSKYSINKGLWGTSVGGEETLTSHRSLPEKAYPSQLEEKKPRTIELSFYKGEFMAIDNHNDLPLNNINKLNEIASKYAIGRDIHIGDTIIGIKGRVGFEAAAPLIIIKAHHALEKHVLTKWQMHHKDYLANWYGTLLHEGQYLDEVMRNIETFLTDSQKRVNGKITVTLYPYRFTIDGVKSPNDLMNSNYASYGEINEGWSANDVKGFIKILSNQNKIYNQVNKEL